MNTSLTRQMCSVKANIIHQIVFDIGTFKSGTLGVMVRIAPESETMEDIQRNF